MTITSGQKILTVAFPSPQMESEGYAGLKALLETHAGPTGYTVVETEAPTVAQTHETLQDLFRRLGKH